MSERLAAIISTAIAAAPWGSFVHVLGSMSQDDVLGRRAGNGIAILRQAVAQPSPNNCEVAVTALAGLGHGLTPSGDDVLAGALLMLFALGRIEQARALAEAVRRIAPARTSPLSYALLEPACDGEPNAATAAAIVAVLTAEPPEDIIALMSTIGATSGFDMLAGLLIVAGR